jgi:hypothetical protein
MGALSERLGKKPPGEKPLPHPCGACPLEKSGEKKSRGLSAMRKRSRLKLHLI